MVQYVRYIAAIVTSGLLAVGLAAAAPVVGVVPETIDRFDNTSVEVSVSGVAGGELWLRLYVDADGDGALGEADYAVWADRVLDNGVEWSPTMPIDQEPASATVTVNVRSFGPMAFPRTVGTFLWHAENPDGSVATARFAVTQVPEARNVSGRVLDATLAPVPGALVLLEPAARECGEPTLSAVASANGDYSIAVPSTRTCGFHVARAGHPGAFARPDDSAVIDLSAGSWPDTELRLRGGNVAAQSSIVFASGGREGEGVPGITTFAETADGAFAVGSSDIDGGVAWSLDGADWAVRVGDPALLTLQGAVASDDLSTSPGGVLELQAANAFVRGTLTDDVARPISGATIGARVDDACAGDCWVARAVTGFDGSYVLAVVGPTNASTLTYAVDPVAPLEGLLASRLTVDVRGGDNLTDRNLDHVAPTRTIRGTVVDTDSDGIAGLCLRAVGADASRTSRAHTDCNGAFSLAVLDGPWNVRLAAGLGTTLLQLETLPDETVVDVGAVDPRLDFIVGPAAGSPFLRGINPPAGPAGTHVVLEGGNFGNDPVVAFDGVPAQILSVRNDLGRLVVVTPAGLDPGTVTVTIGDPRAQTGQEQCFDVLPGSYAATCGISGLVTTDTGRTRVAGALVVAFDPVTDRVERVRVTDARGRYDLGLDDAAANYALRIYSNEARPRVMGHYPSLPCPFTRNHDLRLAREVGGRVIDAAGQPIAGVRVEARGVLAAGTVLTGADGTYTLRLEPGDNVTIDFSAPPASRFINDKTLNLHVGTGLPTLPPIVLESGRRLAGHVVDPADSPLVATIAAEHRATGGRSGSATTNSCDGSFAIALDDGEHRLRLDTATGGGSADVEWVEVDRDGLTPFAFAVSPATPLAFDGSGPRLGADSSTAGRIGQSIALGIENMTSGSVEVLFSAGNGERVAGVGTVADLGRGMAFTRVPAGATSGDVVVRVNGVESLPAPFTVLESTFVQGGLVLRGQAILEIDPVEGVLALLFLVDSDGIACDPLGRLHDFDLSDAAGSWNLNHPGGDVFVLLLPPREGSRLGDPPTTLAPAYRSFRNEFGNRVYSAFLAEGVPLALRAVTGSPPQAVPNARVTARDRTPDIGITGPSGVATVYLAPDFPGPTTVDVEIAPPLGSRLMLAELQATIPADLGDVPLVPGTFVSSQVTADDGIPLVEGAVRGFAGGERVFDTVVRRDGVWRGPVPADGYSVVIETDRLHLADTMIVVATSPARDRITIPGVTLTTAGILAGSVRDALTLAPIAGAPITAFADAGGATGAATAFARTCANGDFRTKITAGRHFVHATPPDPATAFAAWYAGGASGFCPLDAQSVTVATGATTGGVEVAIDAQSTISGTVRVFDEPAIGVVVTATHGRLGSCAVTAVTGRDGTYELTVPAAAGYRIESAAPLEVGGASHCFDGLVGCASFTGVDTAPLAATTNIDFSFIAGPPEVSGTIPLMLLKVDGGLQLSFERVEDDPPPIGYNIYDGALGTFDTAIETICHLDPEQLESDGNGGFIYELTPDPAAEWFLVSASNGFAESTLGPLRVLSNTCGAMPPTVAGTVSAPRDSR